MTQKQVRIIAQAFGFSAVYNPDVREWRIAARAFPSDSYYTNDKMDAVYTILASYRHYRSHNLLPAMLDN